MHTLANLGLKSAESLNTGLHSKTGLGYIESKLYFVLSPLAVITLISISGGFRTIGRSSFDHIKKFI